MFLWFDVSEVGFFEGFVFPCSNCRGGALVNVGIEDLYAVRPVYDKLVIEQYVFRCPGCKKEIKTPVWANDSIRYLKLEGKVQPVKASPAQEPDRGFQPVLRGFTAEDIERHLGLGGKLFIEDSLHERKLEEIERE